MYSFTKSLNIHYNTQWEPGISPVCLTITCIYGSKSEHILTRNLTQIIDCSLVMDFVANLNYRLKLVPGNISVTNKNTRLTLLGKGFQKY